MKKISRRIPMTRLILGVCAGVLVFLMAKVFAGDPGSASDPLVTKSFLEESYGWRITTVPAGEKLTLELGNEAVLRSGKSVVLGSKSGGVADLTIGQDLPDGIIVPPNHYLISAASDGRGMKAVTLSVFLTRGLAR